MASTHNGYLWVFFGSSHLSTIVLDELKARGLIPKLIISTPDKPRGRSLVLTPTEVNVWAQEHNIPCITPSSLKPADIETEIRSYIPEGCDFFLVASYGKIIPQNILDIPRHKTLNIHPSLLPRLRGASPIQSAILSEDETGVTIMRLDAEMDHGPIVVQQKVSVPEWPPYALELEEVAARNGAVLLAEILPGWVDGSITETEQNHSQATYCAKIQKSDGELDLTAPADLNLRKIRAYHAWPGAYFFQQHGDKRIRVVVRQAHIEHDQLVLDRVVPEGKKEMPYSDFLRGLKN